MTNAAVFLVSLLELTHITVLCLLCASIDMEYGHVSLVHVGLEAGVKQINNFINSLIC